MLIYYFPFIVYLESSDFVKKKYELFCFRWWGLGSAHVPHDNKLLFFFIYIYIYIVIFCKFCSGNLRMKKQQKLQQKKNKKNAKRSDK